MDDGIYHKGVVMTKIIDLVPLDATKELLDISVTERSQFKTCRRKWGLETLDNLSPKIPSLVFPFGTGIHAALESFYLYKREERALKALKTWYKDERSTWEQNKAPPEALDELLETYTLGQQMLEGYFKFDRKSKVALGKILAVEGKWVNNQTRIKSTRPDLYGPKTAVVLHPSGRLLAPIVEPLTKVPVLSGACLSGRIDLLSERKTPKRGLWIIDHKTASQAPDVTGVDYDDQITGYCYIMWRRTGIIPRGIVLNVLIKRAPKEPRVVRKGTKLSTAKDQLTTAEKYEEACTEFGYVDSDGTVHSEEHAACLRALKATGFDSFFRRLEVTRNMNQLLKFEERLFVEYHDMEDASASTDLQYPNQVTSPFGMCQGCRVNKICLAMEDGSDWQSVIDTHFRRDEDRKAI